MYRIVLLCLICSENIFSSSRGLLQYLDTDSITAAETLEIAKKNLITLSEVKKQFQDVDSNNRSKNRLNPYVICIRKYSKTLNDQIQWLEENMNSSNMDARNSLLSRLGKINQISLGFNELRTHEELEIIKRSFQRFR